MRVHFLKTMKISDKKIEILKAAEKVFGIRGIDAASVREISKEAKINVAMISYYFGSKDKLVEALFSWRIYNLNTILEDIAQNSSLTPFEKLQEILKTYLNRILYNHVFFCFIFFLYAKKDSILEVAQQINGLKIENLVSIKKVISEGYQKGVFKREAPAEAVVMVVIGGTSYLILNEKTYLELWGIKTHEEFKQRIHSEYYPYLIDSLKAILLYDEK